MNDPRTRILNIKFHEPNLLYLEFADGFKGYWPVTQFDPEKFMNEDDWKRIVLVKDEYYYGDKQVVQYSENREDGWFNSSGQFRYDIDPVYREEIDKHIEELGRKINAQLERLHIRS